MYIIVIGGGQSGYYIARTLLKSSHEVVVIEHDFLRSAVISEQLGNIVVRGDGCEATTLEDIGTSRADLLIAVTGDDEDNLVACQVAKHRFNVPRTIARLKNPRHQGLFKKLGVDVTVSSTNLILADIKKELPDNPLCSLLSIKGGSLEVVNVIIPPDSTVAGKQLGELDLPRESVICMIVSKGGGTQIPHDDIVLAAEDEIVAITTSENEIALQNALIGNHKREGK
ncbi:MAG: TrkA family potassium uptake protein [Chloroflexi bacterium]|jgi:trk system potassium uptake protein|nr:TrkA family potassium uptake protein [Chloroflexota bacterium]MBT7081727.1 TrkA family potassium uptake protein [Chloroflexota bacterium]MBT7290752.1 TrkA family potassium uptake protein [Chloroflexota bacterium]